MTITRDQLGERLREARGAAGLTQDQVAAKLDLSRSTIAQMELGRREVTSIELDTLAYLYGRDIRSFFSEGFRAHDALTVLFRADPELGEDEAIADRLRWCMAVGRELHNLERVLEIDGEQLLPAQYALPAPRSRWDAVQQGGRVASQERSRLDLGNGAIADMAELLEGQGVRAMTIPLPEDIAGLTAREDDAGVLVAVNSKHAVLRRRFSYAHEYAHVLLDRDRSGTVSRLSEHDELIEVRANAFAATFLMPDAGLRQFIEGLGKGKPSRASRELVDEQGTLRAEARTRPGSQDIQIYDVVHAAHAFGVSTIAALYRLYNLRPRILTEDQRDRLKTMIEQQVDRDAREALGLPQPDELYETHDQVRHRLIGLGLEAYRQELISRGKLADIAALVDVHRDALDRLIRDSGIDEDD
ncbi:MAG: XRE family transcriptional regulator [Halofilum sp. (in: g-proteobacteria)]|nr:XRE family transcriptional regulator [Halofilum sp. (in: g-proteobacteria)]